MFQIFANWAMANEVPSWIVLSTMIGASVAAIFLVCAVVDCFTWMYHNF